MRTVAESERDWVEKPQIDLSVGQTPHQSNGHNFTTVGVTHTHAERATTVLSSKEMSTPHHEPDVNSTNNNRVFWFNSKP